jgi:hypothetical protein
MNHTHDSTGHFQLLSRLVLPSSLSGDPASVTPALPSSLPELAELCERSESDLKGLETLASKNHVVVRAFQPLQRVLESAGDNRSADWVADALDRENARIAHALGFLEQICESLETSGCPVIVIKSLDHWPDLGNDLDLYSPTDARQLIEMMRSKFGANPVHRSWGDRLANKWNFSIPGLPELVEVHAGRLGQTGEQTAITGSLIAHAEQIRIGVHAFRVPAPEDRIVISTLQRMYRHFYIRLCDIVDNARLIDLGAIDFHRLRSLGQAAGVWEGIATYLTIVSEYLETYRHQPLSLPSLVTSSASFGGGEIAFRRDFLRVPILPQSLRLYASELKTLIARGELRNTLRLTLLPYLAAAALLEQKLTGSDKGIW